MRKRINLAATIAVVIMFTACSANTDTTAVVSGPSVTTEVADISNDSQTVSATDVVTVNTERTETQPTKNVIDDVLDEWTDNNIKIGANAAAVEVNADSVIDIKGQGFWPNTAYNFVKTMTTGSTFTTEDKTVSFPYEGRWGINAYAEGKILNLKAYSNLGYDPVISSVMLSSLNQDVSITNNVNYTTYYALDMSDASGAYTCDTTKWAELSATIITDPDWSDGYKVMMIHDWICGNIAYDNYRVNTLNTPRDMYYGDCTGTYSVYNTRTGVCFDVSHIFLIMCRYNGIPCMTCESASHQWNAVYVNGIWYEIDMTSDIHRFTNSEDVNSITASGNASYTATNYGNSLYSINNHLWSYECDYGSGNNYGWYYN